MVLYLSKELHYFYKEIVRPNNRLGVMHEKSDTIEMWPVLMMSKTPKRKRFTRQVRLMAAADWVKKYQGKHIISGYAKWFGVDKICAITELRILGVLIPESLENQIKESIKTRIEQKRLVEAQKKDAAMDFNEWDEYIGYIVGYTSGGAPYGLTHEELSRINNDDSEYKVV